MPVEPFLLVTMRLKEQLALQGITLGFISTITTHQLKKAVNAEVK
jgi:hypothetical protein